MNLQDPRTTPLESVAGMDDVSVTGEAGEEVLHTLEQRVYLTVDEHFHHQVFRCPLHQLLPCIIYSGPEKGKRNKKHCIE